MRTDELLLTFLPRIFVLLVVCFPISKSHLKKYITQRSPYEAGTLPDGQQVIFVRDNPVITFRDVSYSRPTHKNQRWVRMDLNT